jgi:alkaline phosphatase D
VSLLEFYDREDRPWPGMRLTSSAIVGHTTPHSSRIWVRVHREGTFCLVYSASPFFGATAPSITKKTNTIRMAFDGKRAAVTAQHQIARITFATDLTHVFDLTGLQPDTRYFYALFATDEAQPEPWEVGRDAELSFRTAGVGSQVVTFGLFSCHMPFTAAMFATCTCGTPCRTP